MSSRILWIPNRESLFLFKLPLNSPSGNYELLVEGRADGRHIFSNRTSLMYTSKTTSVFIQTDKAVYKPGQDVLFRIVTVYPDLKPYKVSLNIYFRVSIHRNIVRMLECVIMFQICDIYCYLNLTSQAIHI